MEAMEVMVALKVLEDNLEISEMEDMVVSKASKDLEEMVDLKILEVSKEGWHNFQEKEVLAEEVEEVKADTLLVKTQALKHQQWMGKQQKKLL